MRLKEKGLIDLDTHVNNYLSSWKIPSNEDWQPKVTLRQLLSHTAGLTVHGFPGYMTSEPLPTLPQILDGQSPANTNAVRVNILPGTQFRYSGGGTTVAQLAVSEHLKKPFPQLMQEQVFNELNLKNSTYEQPLPETKAVQAATAHPWKNQPVKGRFHIYPEMAAAGLWTTPTDLAIIAVEVQKAYAGKSSFISKKTIQEMLTPQKVAPHIGIGFFLQDKGDSTVFEHGGWDEGFVTKFIGYRNLGKGAVIMINSNEGANILEEITRAIAIEYNWPEYVPIRKEFKLGEKPLAFYNGNYSNEKRGKYSLIARNGDLFLEIPDQNPIKLLPQSEDKFYSPYLNLSIEIEKKANKMLGFTLIQEGQKHTFKKDAQVAVLSSK
jgi:CubicO group peptidase (beta-lactamase class C family)